MLQLGRSKASSARAAAAACAASCWAAAPCSAAEGGGCGHKLHSCFVRV